VAFMAQVAFSFVLLVPLVSLVPCAT